jgi:flagellar biosynthesis protein FlhF
MHIKTYIVKALDDAMAQARADLGDEALLLSTRKHGSEYEIVFGAEGSDETPEQPAAGLPSSSSAVYRLDVVRIFNRMIEAGFDPDLASEIVDSAHAPRSSGSLESAQAAGRGVKRGRNSADLAARGESVERDSLQSRVRDEIDRRVRIDTGLGIAGAEGVVIALVGPGGVGKTTTLMKIAAFQVSPNRPVCLLSLDRASLANRLQLQVFARKNGVSFRPIEQAELFADAIAEARKTQIVLIDLPSCTDREVRMEIAAVLARTPGVDVHMTVPGYMNSEALRRSISTYSAFRPSKMLVTKLDEAANFGAAVCAAVASGLALSLFTNGVTIPGDLYAASADAVTDMALGNYAEAACA